MRGILVRIGVDHSYGGWNAPVDPRDNRFTYVPIPEPQGTRFHTGCKRPYAEIKPDLDRFAESVGQDLFQDLRCPAPLLKRNMHLDPDFNELTYGDVGARRGSQIAQLENGDFLAFYAGLKPCAPTNDNLVYALVGVFIIDEVVRAIDVPRSRASENAHTRKTNTGESDIVVRAKPHISGRLERCIPIGEYRDGAYRVKRSILKQWGGLSVNDGYIQRSARPPRFLDGRKFMDWLAKQRATLIQHNNPAPPTDPDPATERVVIVHLRRPRNQPEETRADPFYEFGSFGCTGCHVRNLMNPDRIDRLEGVRLAFAQGGSDGFRLILLTPPVNAVKHADRAELKWDASARPFRYDRAPTLIDNAGRSDFPTLKEFIRADRTTLSGAFSSLFRTRRRPLPTAIASELISIYTAAAKAARPDDFAETYADTMHRPPNRIDHDRAATYRRLLNSAGPRSPGRLPRRRRC